MSDSDDEYESSDKEVIEPLLRENKRLRWTLAKYQKKYAMLKDMLVQKDEEMSLLKDALVEKDKKMSVLKDVLVEKDEKISHLDKKDGEREELLAKQEDTIRNLIRQMNEQTSELSYMTEKLKNAGIGDVSEGRATSSRMTSPRVMSSNMTSSNMASSSPRMTSSEQHGEIVSLKATIDIQSRRNNELSTALHEERRKCEKLERDIDMWRFNVGECERDIEQLKEQKEKLRIDLQRMKRDGDVSKRLLSDVKLQLKAAKTEQDAAQTKAEECKKEAVDTKSQMDKERKSVSKLKEDHDKMKEKFDEYRKGYEDMKTRADQAKKELQDMTEELRVKTHQYSRQNRHFKELERKYREVTEMHNRLKGRMEEKEAEMEEQGKVLKEYQEKVWLKDKVMSDFKTNAEEAVERANELDRNLGMKQEASNTKDEQIRNLMSLAEEMKVELSRNNVEDIKRELEGKEIELDQLQAKLHGAQSDVEERDRELEYLRKATQDMGFVSSSLEEKEFAVTQLEALNSDLRTQITFKDDQIGTLQKNTEEQKILLESQMYDLESYERQVNDKNSAMEELKGQIEAHCDTIAQKDKEIKRHKREKEDVKRGVEWKEKKVVGIEEDVALQRKQLALMEKEIRMRENEVEERESSIVAEMVAMKELVDEKNAKIERLTSDLMEVKEYIEEEAKLVAAKDQEMAEVKDELQREKDLNKTNDPKSIREVAKKQHYAELMKEKRRHEQEVKKMKQKIFSLEEKLEEAKIQKNQLQNEKEVFAQRSKEDKAKHEKEVQKLRKELESQKKAWKDDRKKTDDVEMRFWSEEEKYVEEIRAIELSRQKLKVENESLREDVEMVDGVREALEKKTREVEEMRVELQELGEAKREEKETMKRLLSEGEEVIQMYQHEVQQLKDRLMNEPAINPENEVNGNIEDMRRLIELEYNIGKERKSFGTDREGSESDIYFNVAGNETDYKKTNHGKNVPKTIEDSAVLCKERWYLFILVLIAVPILSNLFPYHVIITSLLVYGLTLGFLAWKEFEKRQKCLVKPGERPNDALSKAISDIYDENQNLRKTVEQLIVRVASESVDKNELARKARETRGTRDDDVMSKELMKRCEENGKTIEALQGIRKELKEETKQLKAQQRTHESTLAQKDKVVRKLEHKLREMLEGQTGDISTEKILEEIREDDERKEHRKNEALERFQKLAMGVVRNTRREKVVGSIVGVVLLLGVVAMVCCRQQSTLLLGSSYLAVFAIAMAIVLALVVKSKNEVARLAQELNEEAARSLESSEEIAELSNLVEKHVEVVTKQKRAISALERQLKVEHQRNENQKLIIAKLTWTIQEGKDIENLLSRSGSYRGQDKKALESALKKMAEDHVTEKMALFQNMRTHFAEDDADNNEKRWIIEDLKQATKDITNALPNVSGTLCTTSAAERKGIWKLGLVFVVCFMGYLWLFLSRYYGLSLLPLLTCFAFVLLRYKRKDGSTQTPSSCERAARSLILDLIFVSVSIATVCLSHSNGYLEEMAFLIIFMTGVVKVLVKKLGLTNMTKIAECRSRQVEELRERVREEIRRQERMAEQMETWKQLLEVERSYNKESDDVITEVREIEQKSHREARKEIEQMKKEKREKIATIEELERELKKATAHCSKQRRQMEELNKAIKDLEKRQKKGAREIDVLKELTKYEKDELSVALNEEKKAKDEILKNVENEKERMRNEISETLRMEKEELEGTVTELEKKLEEERKVAKDFLEQVDSELVKNEKINSEIEVMKGQMEQERETREDLRNRFREINQIRQDREKVLLEQIDELQDEVSKLQAKVEGLTQELEDIAEDPKRKTKSLYQIQEKQISELKGQLSQASKTVEELRKHDKVTMRESKESKERQGKLLKDFSKLQEKSAQDKINLQKKQREIKDLKGEIEKLMSENGRLRQKLDAALLEGSLGTNVTVMTPDEPAAGAWPAMVLGGDIMGVQQEVDLSDLESPSTERANSEGQDLIDETIDNCIENNEVFEEEREKTQNGVSADFESAETQGILHWLGTSGGTTTWKNPGEAGLITITRSSYGHGKSTDVADRKASWCSTSNKPNQWWKIDFGEKRAVLPSAYSLQHGWSGVSGALRNWVLEGSRDGKAWTTLMNHMNDETLTKGYAAATWKIDDVNTPYRFLRVRQTGKNSAGKDSLRLCGLEVYGQLVLND